MHPKYVQEHILLSCFSLPYLILAALRKGGLVPYPAGHRAETRRKIVDSARRLFNRHGFENVSLGQIMAGAGLTHGGFYSYFKSKSDLYADALQCFFTDPNWKSCWEGVKVDRTAPDAGSQVVRAYLSRQHYDNVEDSCPMVALPTDVARGNKRTREAFETVFKAMVRVVEQTLKTSSNGSVRSRHAKAQAIAALCVGGMVVARAVEDEAFADQLRKACIETALTLGGWPKSAKPS
jgi:TetR/AcrR family transcriptional regulator, transcriptional repressor for nem operon